MTALRVPVAVMVLSLMANLATASDHYICVVVTAAELSDEGKLVPSPFVKSQIGQKFAVDRLTGRVLGGPLDNAGMTVSIIDFGSSEMSFRAVSYSQGDFRHSTYIQVKQQEESTTKPFFGTTTVWYPGVYSGTCE